MKTKTATQGMRCSLPAFAQIVQTIPSGLIESIAEARKAIEEAIWIYNHRRLHEMLNYKTPAAFRAEWKEVA